MMDLISVDQIRKYSYTRCAADEECRRKRYLSREWGGTGLQPTTAGWALVFGNVIHKALEDLAKSGSIDYTSVRTKLQNEAAKADYNGIFARDWSALAEGLLRGFVKSVWPALMAEYEVVETEKWIEYEYVKGFCFRARQDLLLRNKVDKHLAYVDYKTTSSTKPQWIASWAKSVQLHSSMYALQKSVNVTVQRAIVIGLNKGYRDDNHRQRSPFTYGYVNREYPMSPQYSVDYKRTKGWELFSPLEEFGDLTGWVNGMEAPKLSEQFANTGPIFPRDDIAETWFRQQLYREVEVADAVQQLQTSTDIAEINVILDKYFKQNFSKCQPAYGFDCEFKALCWTPFIQADPLGSGQYIRYVEDFDIE